MPNNTIQKIAQDSPAFPKDFLRAMPVPEMVYIASENWDDLMARPRVAIVGSRKISTYGKQITHVLAAELARAGIVIVSGLALGVDAVAHKGALEVGGLTIAVLPSSIEEIYPSSHANLGRQIAAQGGALLSEYPAGSVPYPTNFIARNRLVVGLANAVLVTEAAEKSGTLHTARFALEQGKDVLAVPGNITSPTSVGTNNLIKTGAVPVTSAADVFHCLGIAPGRAERVPHSNNPDEQRIIALIAGGKRNGAELLMASDLDVAKFNQTMTMLEIGGMIRALGNNEWALY